MDKISSPLSHHDIESGHHHNHHHDSSDESDEDNLCFSDAQDQAWDSPSHEGHRASNETLNGIDGVEEEQHGNSHEVVASDEDDLESGSSKMCRICHLCLVKASSESDVAIELGCSCKNDLAIAHKECAETWFNIRGNKTCEICGSTAHNVRTFADSEEINDEERARPSIEIRRFWQGHRFLNFLLACLVFAFVVSWLFHFTTPG